MYYSMYNNVLYYVMLYIYKNIFWGKILQQFTDRTILYVSYTINIFFL